MCTGSPRLTGGPHSPIHENNECVCVLKLFYFLYRRTTNGVELIVICFVLLTKTKKIIHKTDLC